MRDIYNIKSKYSEITQGSIITCCLAHGYGCSDIFGCVITARCDFAHTKVDTVHYLPIVPYEEWLKKEIAGYIRHEYGKDIKSRLVQQLKDNKLETSILDRHLSREDITKVVSRNINKQKEAERFMDNYDKWMASPLTDMKNILAEKTGDKLLVNEVKRLASNGNSNFYLIEDWRDKGHFMVILLRDIKSISLDCAKKLSDGVLEEDTDDEFFENNMLSRSDAGDQMYYVDTEVQSPFIEHIMQRFTNNFSRIGLEDLPEANISELLEHSKSILL